MELHFYDWLMWLILFLGLCIIYPTDKDSRTGWWVIVAILTVVWIVIFGAFDYNVVDVVRSIKIVQ